MSTPSATTTLRHLASSFVKRATAQKLKGKKRDEAAIDFFCGAYAGLELAGHRDAERILNCIGYILCVRGYAEVERWAELVEEKV